MDRSDLTPASTGAELRRLLGRRAAVRDDFIFDNKMLAQIIYKGFNFGEITCPTKYFPEASSINFLRASKYGLGVLKISVLYRLDKWNLIKCKMFRSGNGHK